MREVDGQSIFAPLSHRCILDYLYPFVARNAYHVTENVWTPSHFISFLLDWVPLDNSAKIPGLQTTATFNRVEMEGHTHQHRI